MKPIDEHVFAPRSGLRCASLVLSAALCCTLACERRGNSQAGAPVAAPTGPSAATPVVSSGSAGRESSTSAQSSNPPAAGSGGAPDAGSGGQAAGAGIAAPSPNEGQPTPRAGAGGMAGVAGEPAAPRMPSAPVTILGADISSVHEHSYVFVDTDGKTKSIFELLKNHGFNYIRVKTFVDPKAPHGYASMEGGCAGASEPFSDRDHVVSFGQKIKAAGMGFLLDFHYSDIWADPGKQHVPAAWRDAKSIEELAARLKAYTKDVLQTAIAAGARSDMVPIGNARTPGMLMHVPGPETDCWGNKPQPAAISGSAANWDRFALLLRAGIEATREIDPAIQVMLHIENTDELSGVMSWVDNALRRRVEFDVLGLSCYTAFQGQPSVWWATFKAVANAYPQRKFAIAEYNPERTPANLMLRELPDERGLGTFLWEPTRSGAWGNALFTQKGDTMTANAADFAELSRMPSSA